MCCLNTTLFKIYLKEIKMHVKIWQKSHKTEVYLIFSCMFIRYSHLNTWAELKRWHLFPQDCCRKVIEAVNPCLWIKSRQDIYNLSIQVLCSNYFPPQKQAYMGCLIIQSRVLHLQALRISCSSFLLKPIRLFWPHGTLWKPMWGPLFFDSRKCFYFPVQVDSQAF